MYIISLSSIPPRFSSLDPMFEALLEQTARPEAIRLYIPRKYRRFPEWDGSPPGVPPGIEVIRTEEDLGPASKALFAADELKGEDIGILFCDDDRIYEPDWSSRLLEAWDHHPDKAIVSAGFDLGRRHGFDRSVRTSQPRARLKHRPLDFRHNWRRLRQDIAYGGRRNVPMEMKPARDFVRKSGYVDIGEGFGGFLVRPEWLEREIWEIPPVMWGVDDIWLSGHLARNGVGIWAAAGASRFRTLATQKNAALNAAVIDGAGRREANRICARYMRDTYGIWGGRPEAEMKAGDLGASF